MGRGQKPDQNETYQIPQPRRHSRMATSRFPEPRGQRTRKRNPGRSPLLTPAPSPDLAPKCERGPRARSSLPPGACGSRVPPGHAAGPRARDRARAAAGSGRAAGRVGAASGDRAARAPGGAGRAQVRPPPEAGARPPAEAASPHPRGNRRGGARGSDRGGDPRPGRARALGEAPHLPAGARAGCARPPRPPRRSPAGP